MKRTLLVIGMILITAVLFLRMLPAESEDKASNKPLYAVVGGQEQLTPFPDDEATRRIIKRTDLQKEGGRLASLGLYDHAIVKFKESMNPTLLNDGGDVAGGILGIVRVYQRQGKFEEALKEYEYFLSHHLPENRDVVMDRKTELLSLLEWQKTGSPKSIYDHIRYLRNKYQKLMPPEDYVAGFSGGIISDIVHLYDYLGDADSAIAFMNTAIDYLNQGKRKVVYSFAIAEYERVKHAFELDKQTGQKGHLQEVIKDSNSIGW